jgi:hypothetical protein
VIVLTPGRHADNHRTPTPPITVEELTRIDEDTLARGVFTDPTGATLLLTPIRDGRRRHRARRRRPDGTSPATGLADGPPPEDD